MSNEKLQEIKREDRSALKKYAVLILIAMSVGFVFGIVTSVMKGDFAEQISAGVLGFLRIVAPYAILVITFIAMVTVICLYKKSRKIYNSWDGENEEEMKLIEANLSYALWFTSLDMILSFFFFAVEFSMEATSASVFMKLVTTICKIGGFLFAMAFILISQQKIVNFEKEMNPEKKGSVYDLRFEKKWEESCDEAEKLAIYKSAYKAYRTVNFTCVILWLFCTLGMEVWNFGLMPVTAVSIIWLVQLTSYSLHTIHLSKYPADICK